MAFATERLSKEERGGRHGKPPWGNRGKEEGPAELQGKGKKSRQGKTSNHRAAMERKQETGTKAKQPKTEGQGAGSNGGKKRKGRHGTNANEVKIEEERTRGIARE